MMPLHALKFTDSWRTTWVVFEETVRQADGPATACTRGSRHVAPDRRLRTLVFATDMVVRRLTPVPEAWPTASAACLEALCDAATPCERGVTIDVVVSLLLSRPEPPRGAGAAIRHVASVQAVA
jgi:hypothetical protein